MSEEGGDGEAAISENPGGGRRGRCVLRKTISVVTHNKIRQFHRGRQCLSGCVTRTETPVYMRERGGG